MNIYDYAKRIDYSADYYDFHTGYIYLIKNYGLCLKRGLPTEGINVITTDGKFVGTALHDEP